MMENSMTYEKSLAVIQEMVSKTKHNLKESSFFFILWGWLALGAAAVEYGLMQWAQVDWHPIVWPVMGVIGGVGSALYGRKLGKKGYSTFLDASMKYIWIAFGAMMIIALTIGARVSWSLAYSLIIGLYGMGTFITGGFLRFRPLILGGVACWILAFVSLLVESAWSTFPNMLILLMVSLVVGYLVPGYALKNSKDVS